MQPPAVELLAALAPVAERWGRWCVFGAQAVVVYGVPRLSADVDVTLALVPDAPEHFARDMRAAGFSLRVSDRDFVRRTRVMPFVHEPTGMPLDVVLAGSGLEDEFLQRAVPVDIGGVRVPIIELSDLIIAKRESALAAASAGDGCAAYSTHPPAAGGGPGPERPRIEFCKDFQHTPVVIIDARSSAQATVPRVRRERAMLNCGRLSASFPDTARRSPALSIRASRCTR